MSELMTPVVVKQKKKKNLIRKKKEWRNVRTITKNPQSVTVECAPK